MRDPRNEGPHSGPRLDTIAPPPRDARLKYRRIILKLSGEALCGSTGGFGIQPRWDLSSLPPTKS